MALNRPLQGGSCEESLGEPSIEYYQEGNQSHPHLTTKKVKF